MPFNRQIFGWKSLNPFVENTLPILWLTLLTPLMQKICGEKFKPFYANFGVEILIPFNVKNLW